ncbi:MAG: LPS export ABC transporter periplasmic protein LptC [Treponema sp.]|nr:LPS export ABC transporter periplasmic protein LptC [Treponema sp.]
MSFRIVVPIIAMSLAVSCSLKYDQEINAESTVPEFIFVNTSFRRYEDNKKKIALQADVMEQYKTDNSAFAKNVSFQTWNKDDELDTEGTCIIMSINSKDEIYTFFNNILISSDTQKFEIRANNLRWNSKTEQLTSGATDKVFLTHNNTKIEGNGFSASGVSRTYSFNRAVFGSVETTDSTSEQDEESQPGQTQELQP